jgi:hypothetical protein
MCASASAFFRFEGGNLGVWDLLYDIRGSDRRGISDPRRQRGHGLPSLPLSWPFPTIPLPAEKLASPVVCSGGRCLHTDSTNCWGYMYVGYECDPAR